MGAYSSGGQSDRFVISKAFLTGVVTSAHLWSANPAAAQSAETVPADSAIAASTPMAVAFMLSILVIKVTAFVLGYLIVRLGHDTMIKGVTGEIDFGFSGSGFKTKLKAASPGALFVLMGAAIIIWGLWVEKPMKFEAVPPSQSAASDATSDGDEGLHRAPVPD